MKSYIAKLMLQGNPMVRIAFVLCGIIFLSYQDVQATHIVGGDLTYECLGGNRYRITLTVRRDCLLGAQDAPFDDPASIGLFDLTSGLLITDLNPVGFPNGQILIPLSHSDTLNEILVSDCGVIMGNVCVHTTMYVVEVTLPFRPTGYIFAYQRCCRNESLNNVVNPLQTGMTLVAELSSLAQTQCNGSPQFGPFPPIYACVNKEIMFDHSAVDLEGDSLVYELCTPLTGASQSSPQPQPPQPPLNQPIVFRPPYSLSNVMGGVPLQIDSQTGMLTGTPNTIGQFVVGICITAYRNGVVTGRARRDFQFNVRPCRNVPVAAFSAPALDCEDLTVEFDNQSLLADEYLWIFNLDDPNSATSSAFEPVFTYPQGGCYNVALIANVVEGMDRPCPDTIIHQVCVFDSQLDANFTFDVSSCTSDIVLDITDTSNDPDTLFDVNAWNYLITVNTNPGHVDSSVEENPQFIFPVDSAATVTVVQVVTSSNGCTATQVHSFPVHQININVDPNSEHLCRDDSTDLILGGNCDLTYIWSPGVPIPFCDPTVSPDSSTTYMVTVTDGLCEVTATIPVVVQQLPALAFAFETDCRTLTVEFDNNSTGGNLFMWNFGTGNPNDTSMLSDPTFTFPDSGQYLVTLSSKDGCNVSISDSVTANAISARLEPTTTNCFMDSIELNPGGNQGYLYTWSPSQFLDDPISYNPTAGGLLDDTEFCVTITSPGLRDCSIEECITVLIPDAFTLHAGGDVTTCFLDPVLLIATTNPPNADVEFLWSNNVVGDTNEITPTITETYFVTATDSLGCSKTDSVMVIRPPSTFSVDILPGDSISYCNIQTISLVGVAEPGSGVSFNWLNALGDTIGNGLTIDVTPGQPTFFVLIGTDSISRCQESDSIELNPTFFSLSITGDQHICIEEQTQIAITDNNSQMLEFIWAPTEGTTGSMTSTLTVSPSETTEYCATVTNMTLGCLDTLCSTIFVDLFNPLNVVITADPPMPTLTQDVTLSTNQPSTFGFMWSATPAGMPNPIPNVSNPVHTPSATNTIYMVTVTNAEGCTQVASLTLAVDDPFCDDRDIFIPNAFTPNGDGVNDILFVRSNFISSMELHIYNRWGQEVFFTDIQSMGWDGTFKGKKLPPDVFGYYMEISCPNEKTFFKKGNITLLE